MLGWFFQRLEQRIERVLGQHVHLVDEVHLVAPARRQVLRVLDYLAHVVDAGVAGGVDLEQVDEAARIHRLAHRADAAGFGPDATFAIQALGEDARDRGLAHAAGSGEEEGVMHPSRIQRIGQGTDDMLLAHQFGKTPGAPFAREDEIRHGAIVPLRASATAPAKKRPVEIVAGSTLARRRAKGWQPRQPDLGTRISRYRCFLPDLAGFSTWRREGTDGATIETGAHGNVQPPRTSPQRILAERAGFEPAKRGLAAYTLSRRAPSTTRTPLRR